MTSFHSSPHIRQLAVGQMCATDDVEQNLKISEQLIQKAALRHADLLSLPECFAYLGETSADLLAFAQPLKSNLLRHFQKLAQKYKLWLSLGGLQTQELGAKKSRNSHLLISATGELVAHYDKIHLFDVDIPNGPRLLESKSTESGTQVVTADSPVGKLGLSICYDLRFAELYQALTQKGAEVLLIPAAFTAETGKDHWEILLRARAIENQAYVAAAAQHGRHNSKRHSYGHAMIVDPWGIIAAQCSDNTDICVAEIDLDLVRQIRERMPVAHHRHPEIYSPVGEPARGPL